MTPSEISTPVYSAEVYAAALAEDEVWSAAQRLAEAGAVDPEFLRTDRLRTAANAASSAVLHDLAPEIPKVVAVAADVPQQHVAVEAERSDDGCPTLAAAIEALLDSFQPEEMTFSADEVASFEAEAAYAAMEVRVGLSHSFLVREAVSQELHISTITVEGSNRYRVEYTIGEQSTYRKVPLISLDGMTYTEKSGGYVRAGRLSDEQVEDIGLQLASGHISNGRLWGTWKAQADHEKLKRAGSGESVDAFTNLSYAGLDIVGRLAGSPGHNYTPKQAAELQKSGVEWAIDAPSGRSQVSVRVRDGRVYVIKEAVMTDQRDGKETSASRQTYTIGAAGATLDTDFSVGKKRQYKPDRPQQLLDAADVQALVDEVAGLDKTSARVWQRNGTGR
ncbi:MAG TPA: hypothetical protein VGO07_07675 [Candidatus Saccharimonadales bacterium]|nr:hypothetical protein [Candidatus Saccharimonadales bacterium]